MSETKARLSGTVAGKVFYVIPRVHAVCLQKAMCLNAGFVGQQAVHLFFTQPAVLISFQDDLFPQRAQHIAGVLPYGILTHT